MQKLVLLCLAFFSFFANVLGQTQVTSLLCENRSNPACVDVPQPLLSWQLSGNRRNIRQSAYELRVGASPKSLNQGKELVWNSGKISSDQSVHVPYGGSPLTSGKKYYWQVRIWDDKGQASAWSPVADWQMGLLQPGDWKASWIEPGFTQDSISRPSPLFRKTFQTAKKIQSATAYITARGMYEARINGQRVGDAFLTPGWTSYRKRLQYQQYDVTKLLRQGANAIGATLGVGWYSGYLAWENSKNHFGSRIGLLFQLNIQYTDGTEEMIVSDNSWKSSTGGILYSEIYNGETIDARKDKEGWSEPGYDDHSWSGVQLSADNNKDNLIATINEPVRKHEQFKPVKIFTTPAGEKVMDFGQNLVGWVQVQMKGRAGDSIVLQHAEVLDKKGNFYTENLRKAKQQNTYIFKGSGTELFEPHFTFQGFRYVKVTGFNGELSPDNFTAFALYSDMPATGEFSCSNQLINQLQHNIQWGQRGNFLDVPTDCPQRDERLGWTGDAQAFFRTAAYNRQVNNFFAKWMKDVAADQRADGSVPFVVPNVLGQGSMGSAGWADVATIIPWGMYLTYADKRSLEQQYPSMKAWVEYIHKQSPQDLWNTGFHFGDWLFYHPDDDLDGRAAITDKYLIAQCFYAHSTQLLINAAQVLGKTADVTEYTALLQRIKAAFLKEYVTPNGRLVSSSQTAYVLALNFDMLPENLREQAADRLVENIKSYNNHLTTGFLGTPYLCHVLSRFGHLDMAYTLLLQDTYPSWLYPVKMGATTIWERWNGQKPDHTFENAGMNSFNHYAYGAIGDWMYRVTAGIDTKEDAPGYRQIIIRPRPGGSLTQATGTLQTYYGQIKSSWQLQNGQFVLDVEIPANTTATVYMPVKSGGVIMENGKAVSEQKDIRMVSGDKEQGLEIGSGKYHFTTTL
ncbi:glycoside hydrolase family 78 protein [Chitinophaga filiformis]|uniref:glycoside hydrolase family 78 protein n=1 Tax=Chitinophaga filiformis TaxID=104663 RepID=UPI001F200067|nr:glycoside hydrolase family 78 protein [Chitinophaga filiformis]MCF6406416.1 glycoside hydrolase family 78 protein [Chitinophaga filiformis]